MFKHVIRSLSESIDVALSYNDKDILHELVTAEDLNVPTYRLTFEANESSLNRFFKKQLFLFKLIRKLKPKIVVGTTIAIAHGSFATSTKSFIVNEDDYEEIVKTGRIGYPFAYHLVLPNGCSSGRFEAKTIRYKGYHELAYLHPDIFTEDKNILAESNLKFKQYVIMRFSALNAHHDVGVRGIDDHFALRLINAVKDEYQVVITSERPLGTDLEPFRMKVHPSKMHHLLAGAKMIIGDSQTMAAESMVLGTPSIRCNSFVGRLAYLEELENKYELGFGIMPENREFIFEQIKEILETEDVEATWQIRKKKMLSDKINVADFWAQLFLKYARQ